ncbi:MAG: hypothetical protein H7641_03840, partial [Candidatus Heimdallarchaeota archaeon]|nr:hypothetical protein [Candidatus Heimdallarchaeota archaeon]MCK4876695.1 hypothetical protein [Candidatus Heimdallarchaeota archaeon]
MSIAKDTSNNDSEYFDQWNYEFEVPQMYTEIKINEDGSIDIVYEIDFVNGASRTIDIIDIGFPNIYYKLNSVKAWLDGEEVTDVRRSEYIEIGVEIHLDNVGYIPAYESATLQVECKNQKMVFPDETEGRASVVFFQTWFSSQFTSGFTNRTVRFYFPDDLTDTSEVQQRIDFGSAFTYGSSSEGPFVQFNQAAGSPSSSYKVGVAFPEEYAKVFDPFWTLQVFGTIYENMGTAVFVLIIFAIIALVFINKIRKARKYLPPSISSLGGGVRENLNPSAVAILLERPLTQVASLLLFEMMEKGYVSIKQRAPLRLDVLIGETKITSLPKYQLLAIKGIKRRNADDEKFKRGSKSGAIEPEPIHQAELKKSIEALIKEVTLQMKGFSARKTRNHYEKIVEKAWLDMQKSNPELQNAFLWIMVDENYEGRLEKDYDTYYYPHWYARNYYFYIGRSYSGSSTRAFRRITTTGKIKTMAPIRSFSRGVINKPSSFHKSIQRITRP